MKEEKGSGLESWHFAMGGFVKVKKHQNSRPDPIRVTGEGFNQNFIHVGRISEA